MTERVRLDPTRKRTMDEFVISELSAVDRPAQVHATMTIAKRAADAPPMPAGDEFVKSGGSVVVVTEPNEADTARILKAQTTPLSFQESQHYETLTGEARRQFVLANHDERNLMIEAAKEAAQEDGEDAVKYAASREEAAAYDQFSDAVNRIAAEEGMSKNDAMRIARSRDPELVEKVRFGSSTDAYSDGEDIAKARADGRARQARIDDAINKAMSNGTVDRLEALREVRRRQPALFE